MINKINKINKSVVLANILICLNAVNSAETNTPGYSSHERPELSQDQLQRAEEKKNRVLVHGFRVLHDFYTRKSVRRFAWLSFPVTMKLQQEIDHLAQTVIARLLHRSISLYTHTRFMNFVQGISITNKTKDIELIRYIRRDDTEFEELRHDERIHILLGLTNGYYNIPLFSSNLLSRPPKTPPFIHTLEKHLQLMGKLETWALKAKLYSTCKDLCSRYRFAEEDTKNPSIDSLLQFIIHNRQSIQTQSEILGRLENDYKPTFNKQVRSCVKQFLKERSLNSKNIQPIISDVTSHTMNHIFPLNPEPAIFISHARLT
jgi:hypothetical protein